MKAMGQIKMNKIVSIQMIGKKTGNPYHFKNLEKMSLEDLEQLQDMEIKRYNTFIKETV